MPRPKSYEREQQEILLREYDLIYNDKLYNTETNRYILLTKKNIQRVYNSLKDEILRVEEVQRNRENNIFERLLNENKFNEIIEGVLDRDKFLTETQTNRLWNKIQSLGRHLMYLTKVKEDGTISKDVVTLNETTRDYFLDLMSYGRNYVRESGEGYGSDVLAEYDFISVTNITIEKYEEPTRIIKNKDGKFFAYINSTKLDLSKYQIYNQEQACNKKNMDKREHCLIHTLLECGVSKAYTNQIKMSHQENCSIRKTDLKKIATIIKRNIILNYMNSNENCNKIYKKIVKADEADYEPIEISIYENHYFVFEKTKYSKYCIDNYEDVMLEKEFNNIIKKRKKGYDRSKDKYKINNLLMVDKLFKKKLFKRLDLSRFAETNSHIELKKHIYLDNIDNEQRLCETNDLTKSNNSKDKKEKPDIYYADCESYVQNNPHTLQLLGVVGAKSDIVDILNVRDPAYKKEEVCREQMLIYNFLNIMTKGGKNSAICYFHNLKYDYHLFEKYINIKDR